MQPVTFQYQDGHGVPKTFIWHPPTNPLSASAAVPPSASPANPEMPTSEVTPSTGPAASPAQSQDVGSSGPCGPFQAALRHPDQWSVVWAAFDGTTTRRTVVRVDEVLRNISPAQARDELDGFIAVRCARLVRNTEVLP